MKEVSWYLIVVVTLTLRGEIPAQGPIFNHPIECTRGLVEFSMYAWYSSHDDATLSYMEDVLGCFHTLRDAFLLGTAVKKVDTKACALAKEVVKKQKIDNATIAETWTPSKTWCEINAWQDCISHRIDASNRLDATFNFPTIHLMSH